MRTPLKIESLKNQRIRDVMALDKAKERKARGVFAMEGARELERALRCGYDALEVFVCNEALSEEARSVLRTLGARETPRFDVTPSVFAKLAMREGSDGLVAVLHQKSLELAELSLSAAPFVLAVEGVEKPGNLGAVLRAADGAGVDAVVVLDQTVDVYNPHVIRASLGTVFHVAVAVTSATEFHAFAAARGWSVYGAALSERTIDYGAADYGVACAVVLGSEAGGLSTFWLENATALVRIPMLGVADSLNVATAGAVIAYEARRQRQLGVTT